MSFNFCTRKIIIISSLQSSNEYTKFKTFLHVGCSPVKPKWLFVSAFLRKKKKKANYLFLSKCTSIWGTYLFYRFWSSPWIEWQRLRYSSPYIISKTIQSILMKQYNVMNVGKIITCLTKYIRLGIYCQTLCFLKKKEGKNIKKKNQQQ